MWKELKKEENQSTPQKPQTSQKQQQTTPQTSESTGKPQENVDQVNHKSFNSSHYYLKLSKRARKTGILLRSINTKSSNKDTK